MNNHALSVCIEPLEARIAPAFTAVLQLSDLTGLNGFQINGVAADDYSGSAVSSAGDVNGDGFDDLIIGAFRADPNGNSDSGASYVVFGKSASFPATLNLSTLDGNNGFKINGENPGDYAGAAVSGAGDINGDGFDDLLVGARRAAPNGFASGASYVIFGRATGFAAALNLSTLDGSNGFKISGEAFADSSGRFLSDAGDVNGDGFDDILISSFAADPDVKSMAGVSYVLFGKATGFTAAFNLSTLDGTNGFRINGAAAGDYSGSSVSRAGDVNGDGFGDVIVGAFRADPNGNTSGASYVIFGKASGFAAALNVSALDGTNGFQINGENVDDYSGISVSGAGDINGDGFDDLLIGAFAADPGAKDMAGATYVVFGKATGFSPALNLSALNGSNGFEIDGARAGDFAGSSVSGVGDVNGDGFDDVLIGAFGASSNGNASSGSAYLVFGKSSGFGAVLDLSDLNGVNGVRINGEAAADNAGNSVSGAGDVNGDGFDDLLIGAYGVGQFVGASYVVFGQGPDPAVVTLHGKRKATFTDVDGDLVTIKASKGTLKVEDFTLFASGQGAQLALVDFSGESEFTGLKLKITAKVAPGPSSGDGAVNVGHINASGIDLGKVKMDGDLGQIDAGDATTPKPGLLSLKAKSLGAFGVATQLPGGSMQSDIGGAVKTVKLGSIQDARFLTSGDIGSVKINGAVLGGSISSDGKIGSVTITGDLAASAAGAATVSARGTLAPSSNAEALAIGNISIGGSVDHAQILAGYTRTLAATNPDAAIGKVTVSGSWSASSLVAGVDDRTGDGFGRNDALIIGGSPGVIARIASITIKGAATGSAAPGDHFGITAEMIGKAKIDGAEIALPGDDDNVLLDTANNDFRLREVRT